MCQFVQRLEQRQHLQVSFGSGIWGKYEPIIRSVLKDSPLFYLSRRRKLQCFALVCYVHSFEERNESLHSYHAVLYNYKHERNISNVVRRWHALQKPEIRNYESHAVCSIYEYARSNPPLWKMSCRFSEFSETQKSDLLYFGVCFAAVCYYNHPLC